MASGAGGSASAGTSSSSSCSSSSGTLARDDSKWYFTAEQLANSPSRKCGMDADQELMYRQRAANLIQDMGQRLQVSQLCINTAIVYMHRFYAFHSFTQFHRNSIAAAALFLAAKVEEQPRKLEHIIKVVHICLGIEAPDPLKESYAEQAQDLVFNENVLLQTLGFDVAIDHPHTHVVKTCHLVKASKDLAQTSYFMASNSLHLTTMCLQYKPTVVACFCIHLACKWSRWEIPQSNEGRHWFHYVDKTVTLDLLKQLTDEFLHIFDRCPTRLKSKMKSIRAEQPQTDDSGRRTTSAMSGSSSSISRGIDDAGSSSSHHRSSSHSQHSHSKQSSSSGDPSLKASQQSSSNHKIPTSSSSSRSRDRQVSSSSQALHQQQIMASGGHFGTGGSSTKLQPVPHHSSSSRSGMPSQSSSSSSSSSSRYGNTHEAVRDPKIRMMPTAAASSSSSSMQMHPYGQNKADRHSSSGQKAQSISHMDGKNPIKSQSSMMAPLFGSNQDVSSRTSSSSMMKQPSASYGSHPPSYSQSMSNRNNNLPSNESISVPNQQQFKNQMQQQLPVGSESSFRLIDDSNRLTEHMQMCTPPKQSKPSSIFSPDWKDNQTEGNNSSLSNTSTGSTGGKSRSQGQAAGVGTNVVKPIKESPGSKEKKPLLPPYSDQQQKQRSDTPKKERRPEMGSTTSGSGNHPSKSSDKKPSSSSLKRSLDISSMDPVDLLGLNKISSGQAPQKRSLPSSEQVRQEDGTDFRESKVRKVEIPSPSESLFASSFDLSSTFDKQDDSFSLFPCYDPSSLLSQPLLSDSKPTTTGKTSFTNTINGIETNPALVSSLLKESLCNNDNKFGTLNSSATTGVNVSNNPTTNSSAASTISAMSATGAPAHSVSTLTTSSATSIVSNVPETIKTEASSLDVTAPSAISSLLAQSAPTVSAAASLTTPTTGAAGNISATASTISNETPTLTGDVLVIPAKDDDHRRSKSEKKKKKDKHKHKEKDKSKDKEREERKKHKKDKDRHRDREREKSDQTANPELSGMPPGPIKIKLPKDKLNLHPLTDSTTSSNPPSSDMGLKIKIPKDRLSGASSLNASTSSTTTQGSTAPPGTSIASNQQTQAPNPLKLKISKDKIEHYNISAGSDTNFNNGSGHVHAGHHGHSSKKKDREKDRDKSKPNKSTLSSIIDYNKHNGNGNGGGSSASAQAGNSSSKSSSSKKSVPIIQQQQSSLNQMTAEQLAAPTIVPHHPASFDYMQHAQAPTIQQQQYFSQFGAFASQQQQQINNSGMKISGSKLPALYYGTSNSNNGSNTSKK